MSSADLSTLIAVIERHAEQHGRVPAHMVLTLVAAFKELQRAIPPVPHTNLHATASVRGNVQ